MVDNPFGNKPPVTMPNLTTFNVKPPEAVKVEFNKPQAPVTRTQEILKEYNYIESDIPINHEYWQIKYQDGTR